ncbi:MAG: penicillin-binding protein 2 [Candidatus Omnitrophica bacterium]|nr:penicillin-binding protein 2 [Candidatus Omnitrophota bacterium]
MYIELAPRRGNIYDRHLRPQVINLPRHSLYAIPYEINNKDELINKLSSILGLSYNYLRERIYRDKAFIWLARKIGPDKEEQIRQLNQKGLGFIKENIRAYPNRYLASHLIGFTDIDNVGLEGVEFIYNDYLRGKPGFGIFLRDGTGKILDFEERIVLPQDGLDVVLTIDEVIQYIAERELDKVFRAFKAKGASIVILNPYTGEILAMANRPTFDLNYAKDTSADFRRNRAITDIFEPGSSFKIVTAAAALESEVINEEDKIFCENGSYRLANHILHDHQPHGWLNFREVIEQSSNIGVAKIAQILGAQVIYRYIKAFGFGSILGVDLPGEMKGMVKSSSQWSKTSIGAIPIGHEVGVTALQLACAISVVANGGLLMRPFVLKEIRDKYGERIKQNFPFIIRRAIQTQTALRLKEILIGVVERGTGKLARIEGIKVAGKTGTAQKVGPDGHYVHDRFVASFIGFAPADNPRIAMCIVVDEPRPYYFGGVVCAPVFKKVASEVLRYLNVSPIEAEEKIDFVKKQSLLKNETE